MVGFALPATVLQRPPATGPFAGNGASHPFPWHGRSRFRRSQKDSPMIVPSQCVLRWHGPELNGVGGTMTAPQLPGHRGVLVEHPGRSWGIRDWRFIQSTSRTPVHSVQRSPLPGQFPPGARC